MFRFDVSNIAAMAVAVASSLGVAWWIMDRSVDAEPLAAPAYVETSAPSMNRAPAGGVAQLTRASDGHYWAEAMVDGRAVRMLVDTGASLVVLTREDALRLGLRLKPEDFTARISTASGEARAARVQLDSVSVAGAQVAGVEATVVEAGLPHSLLGMSYLGRLSGFQVDGGAMTLRP